MRGGETACYTLNAHMPNICVEKFAVKLVGTFCQHMAKYTKTLSRLRIQNTLEHKHT